MKNARVPVSFSCNVVFPSLFRLLFLFAQSRVSLHACIIRAAVQQELVHVDFRDYVDCYFWCAQELGATSRHVAGEATARPPPSCHACVQRPSLFHKHAYAVPPGAVCVHVVGRCMRLREGLRGCTSSGACAHVCCASMSGRPVQQKRRVTSRAIFLLLSLCVWATWRPRVAPCLAPFRAWTPCTPHPRTPHPQQHRGTDGGARASRRIDARRQREKKKATAPQLGRTRARRTRTHRPPLGAPRRDAAAAAHNGRQAKGTP